MGHERVLEDEGWESANVGQRVGCKRTVRVEKLAVRGHQEIEESFVGTETG